MLLLFCSPPIAWRLLCDIYAKLVPEALYPTVRLKNEDLFTKHLNDFVKKASKKTLDNNNNIISQVQLP
jgi:hypothetical protein